MPPPRRVDIRDAITRAVDEFCHPIPKTDDITLVVIKVTS